MTPRALLRAVISPLQLTNGGVGLGLGVALSSPALVALGALGWLSLAAWELLGSTEPPRQLTGPISPTLPDPDTLQGADLVALVTRLETAGREIEHGLVRSETGDHLGEMPYNLQELQLQTISLLRRADELGRYLTSADPGHIRQEIVALQERLQRTRDEKTRQEYQQACDTREQQLATLESIATERERALATLSRVLATLEGIPPRLIRLRALDGAAMAAVGGDISHEIQRIHQEVRAFEETLSSMERQ